MKIVLAVLSILLLVPAMIAQEPIRVESALVNVPVIVTDQHGRFMPGLKQEEFELLHDGLKEEITHFATSEDPVNIALLLDTSVSTTTVLKKIKQAAERFLLQMRPQDRALVMTFDSKLEVLCPLSSDRRELKEAIKKVREGGSSTKLRDAIFQIVQKRFRSIPGRKAIVLLTDGQDHGSTTSTQELFDAIAASSTLIYPVFYKVDPIQLMEKLAEISSRLPREAVEPAWRKVEAEAAEYLERIADLSAGRFYQSDVAQLDRAFKQISEELRSQYLIGFYPGQSRLRGETHLLEVRVSIPDAVVRSRRSYRTSP